MVVEPVVRNTVAGREPSAPRGPCAPVASVEVKGGVATPLSQLLPAETVEEPSSARPPSSLTARFRRRRAVPVAKWKPFPALAYAVLRFRAMAPVLEFSVKPCSVLSQAALSSTTWATEAPPPPSSKPLPLPSKAGSFQRFSPLPKAQECSMVTGEENCHRSRPSSELSYSRAPVIRLPVPEPNFTAMPSAFRPCPAGS